MNSRLEQEAQQVLGVVSHTQHVFGGDVPPAEPPEFAPRRDLEDDLGRGYFDTSATTGSRGSTQRYVRSVGDNEHADNGDADTLIPGVAWNLVVGRSETQR